MSAFRHSPITMNFNMYITKLMEINSRRARGMNNKTGMTIKEIVITIRLLPLLLTAQQFLEVIAFRNSRPRVA